MTNKQSLDLDRVRKLVGDKGIESLGSQRVAGIGLGSLGGQIMVWLAQSGVSRFILVDKDTVGPENIVRHVADGRYIGWPKVNAVQDLIHHRNPVAEIVPVQAYAQEAKDALALADLVIVAGLGSEAATGQVAQILRELEKPTIFAGLFERAVGGDVFYIDPRDPNGPCYACVATLVSDSAPVVEKNIDYGRPLDELKSQPGLAPDIAHGAIVATKWALRLLVNDPEVLVPFPGNYFVFANEAYDMGEQDGKPVVIPPASGRWLTLRKRSGCLICGGTDPSTSGLSIDDLLT